MKKFGMGYLAAIHLAIFAAFIQSLEILDLSGREMGGKYVLPVAQLHISDLDWCLSGYWFHRPRRSIVLNYVNPWILICLRAERSGEPHSFPGNQNRYGKILGNLWKDTTDQTGKTMYFHILWNVKMVKTNSGFIGFDQEYQGQEGTLIIPIQALHP